jgi:hypothetical protein
LRLLKSAEKQDVRFLNSSGHDRASQDVVPPLDVFDRFFAGRGIALNF